MNLYRRLRYLVMGAAVLLPVACATTTNVDYRQDYDFSAIRSVTLVLPLQTGSSDPRISGPLIDARVNTAITQALTAHGYRVVDQGADVRLAWMLAGRSGLESDSSGISFGFGTFGRHSAVGVGYGFPFYDVESYDEAVLTIDILDPADDGLLWRGSASRRLYDGMTPDKLTGLVNQLVNEVLGQFPPGESG